MPSRLTLGELWAVPTALRILLLLRLCEAAETDQDKIGQESPLTGGDGDATVVAGCIISLRTVATLNWADFVERTSSVERHLRKDPSGFYQRMDFSTRDRYRKAVEQIARRTACEQQEVAQAALELAQRTNHGRDGPHTRHVGYYLIDGGRSLLKEAVGYRRSLANKMLRRLRGHRAGLYLGAIMGLATWGSVALLEGLLAENIDLAVCIAAAIIALIPLLSVSSGAVNFLLSLRYPPGCCQNWIFPTAFRPNTSPLSSCPCFWAARRTLLKI